MPWLSWSQVKITRRTRPGQDVMKWINEKIDLKHTSKSSLPASAQTYSIQILISNCPSVTPLATQPPFAGRTRIECFGADQNLNPNYPLYCTVLYRVVSYSAVKLPNPNRENLQKKIKVARKKEGEKAEWSPGFRMVRPVKSRRHDQTVSPSWCPWLDLANKCSQGLVGISPRLVSLFPPRIEGREGVLISKFRCM